MEGKKFILDEQRLRRSCLQKISEAQEREQYVAIFMGRYHLGSIGEKIAVARRAYQNKEYALCLITAAQAKADSNTILSSIGLSKDAVPEFLESKSKAVERVIAENSAEGIFPILGYSYYQYAGHLAKEDEYTSLIYLEYALEISDLGIYFPEEQTFFDKVRQRFWIREEWILVGEGFLLGVIVAALVVILRKRLQPSGRKKRKN